MNVGCSGNGLKFCHRKNKPVVSNELLCLHDIYMGIFLWVACKEKNAYIAFQEFLCLADGGVSQEEI